MRFEWDENKNQLNFRKHGINFCDAAYVFSDPYALMSIRKQKNASYY